MKTSKSLDWAELNQALFEEAGDALFLFDPDSDELVDVNPAAQRLCGFSRQELMKLPATYLFRFEGKGGMQRLRHASKNTGIFHSQEGYFLRTAQDGVWIPVNLTITRLHVQPKTLGLITARDLSEQRESHQRLVRMEAELRRVLASVSDCLWSAEIDASGQWAYRYFSPVVQRITGQPPEFFLAGINRWWSAVHPEDRPRWERALVQMRSGMTVQEEYRILRPDGAQRWVRDSVVASRGPDGRSLRLDGVITDISGRKQAELALREREARLRLLIEQMPGVLWTTDRELYITSSVGNGLAAINLRPNQLVGTNLVDFLKADANSQLPIEAHRRALSGVSSSYTMDWRQRNYQVHIEPLYNPDGSIGGTIGVALDLTERKQAEEEAAKGHALLRGLIDSIPDLIFYKNREGVYLGGNTAFEQYIGRKEKDFVGRTDLELFPRDIGLAYQERDRQILADGQPRRSEEWLAYPDGRKVLVETLKTPFFGPQGEVLGLIGISRDITERRRLEEQLRQTQKMDAVGQLAGGVAHDFNNLLTAIVGNVSLLLSSKHLHEADRELLTATEQAAQRATDLTRQLLGFSRQTMLRLQPTNLCNSIQEVVAILRRTIDPRIHVVQKADPDLWPVQADPGQMNQVLLNLCLNARDAMPQGGTLTIEATNLLITAEQARLQLDARAGEYVRLRVSDTGHGIPPEIRPRIFEPFFTTKGPGRGTGLGLAMVFGIVKQHQGWIECHTEVERGTRFDIYLPRLKGSPTPAIVTPPAPALNGGSETILLVDDEAVIRNLGRAILQRQGYRVLLAEDGKQAVEIYQKEKDQIDLVILDLTMPQLSGRDALRCLLKINPRVRVLFSSGYSAEHVTESEKDGVLGFINKPYRPQELANTVRDALDRRTTAAE
jgi:hypothetical protein